jgi:hypothetical protein
VRRIIPDSEADAEPWSAVAEPWSAVAKPWSAVAKLPLWLGAERQLPATDG